MNAYRPCAKCTDPVHQDNQWFPFCCSACAPASIVLKPRKLGASTMTLGATEGSTDAPLHELLGIPANAATLEADRYNACHDLKRTVDFYNALEWEPIATAPTDGSVFVAFVPHSQTGFQFSACINLDGDLLCMMSGDNFTGKATHWTPQHPFPENKEKPPEKFDAWQEAQEAIRQQEAERAAAVMESMKKGTPLPYPVPGSTIPLPPGPNAMEKALLMANDALLRAEERRQAKANMPLGATEGSSVSDDELNALVQKAGDDARALIFGQNLTTSQVAEFRRKKAALTPAHYAGAVTPWDLQKCMKSSGNAFVDARRADVMEYAYRIKDDLLGDLIKARHCLDEAIEVLKSQPPTP